MYRQRVGQSFEFAGVKNPVTVKCLPVSAPMKWHVNCSTLLLNKPGALKIGSPLFTSSIASEDTLNTLLSFKMKIGLAKPPVCTPTSNDPALPQFKVKWLRESDGGAARTIDTDEGRMVPIIVNVPTRINPISKFFFNIVLVVYYPLNKAARTEIMITAWQMNPNYL